MSQARGTNAKINRCYSIKLKKTFADWWKLSIKLKGYLLKKKKKATYWMGEDICKWYDQ